MFPAFETSIVVGLFRASAGLAVAALVVAAVARALRLRAPRAEQCAWALVLAQGLLLAPVVISVPAAWLGTPPAAPVPLAIASVDAPRALPAAPAHEPISAEGFAAMQSRSRREQPPRPLIVGERELVRAPRPPLAWSTVAAAAWLAGVVFLVARGVLRYVAFARRLPAVDAPPVEWQAEWKQVRSEQHVSHPIPLVVTEHVGPALCRMPGGYRLVVPAARWRELTPTQRLMILRHELTHYRRGDLWTALAARGVALVHWFNPLAWWAAARFEAQSEFACDQAAAQADPLAFSEALVRLGSARPLRVAGAHAAQSGSLTDRVGRLLGAGSRSSRWRSALVVVLAMLALAPAGLRLQSVAVSSEPPAAANETRPATEPPAAGAVEATDDVVPAPAKRGARALVQLGTNNLRIHGSYVADIAFSPDGRLIAAAGINDPIGRVWLFEVATGREAKQLILDNGPRSRVRCLRFSPDNTTLLWGESSGHVAL